MRRLAIVPGLALALSAHGLADTPTIAPGQLARDAAAWVAASEVKTPAGSLWPADPSDPKTQGTTLYSGSAGVVLFMLEVHRATGDAAWLARARRGADHLLSIVDAEKEPGLYTGLAGYGFVLGEVHKATGDARYRAGVLRILDRLQALARPAGAGVEWSPVTDIIGGSAGIGLFLLDAGKTYDRPGAVALATRAGRRLVELGRADALGLKWAMDPTFPRLMPNFSHGAAGVAYFLATLYRDTKERAFLDAALAGGRYLQSIAVTDGDVCLVRHHEPQDDGKDLFYLGWCHGPAGTARLFYRLYQVTGDQQWMAWVRRSARGVMASGIPDRQTAGFWNNVGQCCGSAGVADFFLSLHRATGDAEYRAFAERITRALVAGSTIDAAGARWVHAENRVSPDVVAAQTGWMQGASGIGAWLLRWDAFTRGTELTIRFPDSPFGETQ